MRDTITFPRPYHRSLRSTVLIALLGATLLVLGLPGPIAEQSRQSHSRTGGVAVVQGPTR
jgi:hypothetical protein